MTDWTLFLDAIQQLLEAERTNPVRSPMEPANIADELQLSIPPGGRAIEDVVNAMVKIGQHAPLTSSPRFFNQLFSGRIDVATMADMLASFLNNSMYTYRAAGPHVVIEKMLIDKMKMLAGFDHGEGTFTPGGSMSNLLGLVLARDVKFPSAAEDGWPKDHAVGYTSALSHYSLTKSAAIAGLGRRNIHKVPTDARGRMSPQALRSAIADDRRAGKTPFFVNLTAGTTVLGAFDPLEELIDIAHGENLWVHVDGAFGGSMLLSEAERFRLNGIEKADSFTWDAHKLMGVPLTSSVCLVREPGALRASLAAQADYLFQGDEAGLDRGQTSLQCGRRNDALKLWAAWSYLGDDGYAKRIETMIARAKYAAERITREANLKLTKAPESTNICFSVIGADAPTVTRALTEQKRAMVGYATVDGEEVVRLALTTDATTNEDLDTFFDDVLAVAEGG